MWGGQLAPPVVSFSCMTTTCFSPTYGASYDYRAGNRNLSDVRLQLELE